MTKKYQSHGNFSITKFNTVNRVKLEKCYNWSFHINTREKTRNKGHIHFIVKNVYITSGRILDTIEVYNNTRFYYVCGAIKKSPIYCVAESEQVSYTTPNYI